MTRLAGAIRRQATDGIVLAIRVTPKAASNAIAGLQTVGDNRTALQIRVTAPPDKGKANSAVITLLAKQFGFAKSALTIVTGETSRDKQINIAGKPGTILREIAGYLDRTHNGDQ